MFALARTVCAGLLALGVTAASQPATHPDANGSLASQFLASRTRTPSARYDDYFRKYSKRYFGPGFAWRLFKAQAMAESGLDSAATSAVGARGIMQIMPSTFAILSARSGDVKSPEDPQTNIAAGIEHDAYLWQLFGKIEPHPEHYRFMVGAYNAGEGTIQRAQRIARAAHADATSWVGVASVAGQVPHWRYRETLGYVDRIATYYHRLQTLDAVPPVEMDLEQK